MTFSGQGDEVEQGLVGSEEYHTIYIYTCKVRYVYKYTYTYAYKYIHAVHRIRYTLYLAQMCTTVYIQEFLSQDDAQP